MRNVYLAHPWSLDVTQLWFECHSLSVYCCKVKCGSWEEELAAQFSSFKFILYIEHYNSVIPTSDEQQRMIIYWTNTETKHRSSVWKTKSTESIIQQLVEPPLAAITQRSGFLSVSHMVVEEFCPTLLSNVASVHWGLQHWFLHSSLKVPPQQFNQVEVWT